MLTCKGTDAPDCLTAPQATALRKIYDGPKNPRTGEQIYPGYPPGIESAPTFNIITPWRPGMSSWGDTYFGQAAFEQENWDPRTLDFDKDIAFSDRKGSPVDAAQCTNAQRNATSIALRIIVAIPAGKASVQLHAVRWLNPFVR